LEIRSAEAVIVWWDVDDAWLIAAELLHHRVAIANSMIPAAEGALAEVQEAV
jgi:hypothetical protein